MSEWSISCVECGKPAFRFDYRQELVVREILKELLESPGETNIIMQSGGVICEECSEGSYSGRTFKQLAQQYVDKEHRFRELLKDLGVVE